MRVLPRVSGKINLFLSGTFTDANYAHGMEIGDRIRDYRKARGLSQPQLATAVGVHRSAVGQWETRSKDIRKPPSRENLIKVANTLGVRVSDLTGDASDETEMVVRDPQEIALVLALRRMPHSQREASLNLLLISAGLAQGQKRNSDPGKSGKVPSGGADKKPA